MENPDRVGRSQDLLARSPAFQYMNGNISPYLCFCIVLTTLTNLCFIGFSALTFDEQRAILDEYARRVYIHNYTCMRIHIRMEKRVKSLNVNFPGKETTSDVYAIMYICQYLLISLKYCA
jgi:hypothetical protein